MLEYLFDIYQKWLITNDKSTFYKFRELPCTTKIVLALFVLLLIIAIFLLMLYQYLGVLSIISALLVEILSCILLNSHHKSFIRKQSETQFANRIDYYIKLKTYLLDCLKEINQTEAYFPVLKNDIEHKISDFDRNYDRKFESLNNLFSALLVPIAVALVVGISEKELQISEIVNLAITIALIIFALYFLVWLTITVIKQLSKLEIDKYRRFADDINSLITLNRKPVYKVKPVKKTK